MVLKPLNSYLGWGGVNYWKLSKYKNVAKIKHEFTLDDLSGLLLLETSDGWEGWDGDCTSVSQSVLESYAE